MPIEKIYKGIPTTTALQINTKKSVREKLCFALGNFRNAKLLLTATIVILFSRLASSQTTLINPATTGGFESGTTFAANGWSTAMAINQWYLGTAAAGYTGARGAFIGTNSTTNAYLGITAHSHFYTDVTVPANEPNLTLTFSYKSTGNANSCLTVYLAPTTYTPSLATVPTFSYIIGNVSGYYGYGAYTTITINITCTTTGSRRLIFSWNNTTTVNNPPAAIDNISLVSAGCSAFSGTGYNLIGSLPYSSTSRTTCGKVNDYTSANTTTCGSTSYLGGEDEIFEFTPTSSGIITASISNASSTSGMMLYQGCPSTSNPCGGGASCVAYNQTSATNKSLCASVTSGLTYFFLVDAISGCYTYDISITAPSGSVANDDACGATAVTIGTVVSDDNSCATGTGEPSTPACWSAGVVNSLWYSFTAPSSGQVHVGFIAGSLQAAQIDLYSGSCGSLSYVSNSCKDSSTMRCPGAVYSGLSSGSTYYLRFDGGGSKVGNYSISIDDNSGTLTPLSQDCGGAVEICSNFYNAPSNSLGCGNISDVYAGSVSDPSTNPNCCNSGCMLIGETNPRWYRLNIASAGSLHWTLTEATATGFFDWAMWNITSSSCYSIDNNGLAPTRCNWNGPGNGSTGMESPAPNGNTSNFESPLTVSAGDTYILCITNYSVLTSGSYTLDFSNSTCTFGGSTATWNGYGGTNWSTTGSWSGCSAPPSCSINAIINSTQSQPVISANASVKDLTINTGTTLTINAGITLTICGNFTNNGTLTCAATSTILFNGTGTQTMSGSFSGSNKLGNLTVTKSSGTVVTNANIDIAGNFTTSNSTSVFNSNGKYIKVAGDFSNSSGSTTYTSVGSGTLEFNGATYQTYTAGGSLTLNNVKINQTTTTAVTLSGANMTINGTLTLTNGRVSTGSYEVNVTNSSTGAAPTGSANSYVDGSLRRSVNSTGSYDFAVGQYSSGKGWQRANINFTSASNVTNLLAKFQAYSSVPGSLGLTDCSDTYNMPALDNGMWSISATPAMTSGTYTTTLYNTSGTYTNSSGASNWTVMKDDGSGWGLSGTCAASTVNVVVRTGMSGFSNFGTAQASTVLPITLTSFTGAVVSTGNWLQWVTSSELNNDYFIVEKSSDAVNFSELLRVNGSGTSKDQHTYEGYDFAPYNGTNYYRLSQVDFNGHTTYSDVVALNNYSQSTIVSNIAPNPTTGDVHISVDMPIDAIVKIDVLNIFGTVLNSFSTNVKAGFNTIPASLNVPQSGIYLLRITCDEVGYLYQSKVVKY